MWLQGGFVSKQKTIKTRHIFITEAGSEYQQEYISDVMTAVLQALIISWEEKHKNNSIIYLKEVS